MNLKDVIMSGGILPAMLKDGLVKKDEEIESLKKQVAQGPAGTQAKAGEGMKKGGMAKKMNNGGPVYTEKMGKPPQDIDGASATRSPKKGEKITYEQPGSGIIVDGKPLNDSKPIKKAGGGMTASRRADGIASKGKTRGKMC
jgi:hypothetical protein